MEGRARMKLTTIPIPQILSLAQQFCKERPSRKKKFGRPLTYPKYLILTLFTLKQVYRLSYRQIPNFVRNELRDIPCLSTLHYRVKKIEQERFEEFLRWLSKKGGFMRGKGEVLVISDGTGFSYGSYCLIGWYRGRVMKKVKAHCKVVFVLGERGEKRMILGVRVESSYGDERKMFLSWLRG